MTPPHTHPKMRFHCKFLQQAIKHCGNNKINTGQHISYHTYGGFSTLVLEEALYFPGGGEPYCDYKFCTPIGCTF